MENKNTKKIAIIGAGLSGLILAYRLLQYGHNVSVFEKENYGGGLVSGFRIENTNIEKTYHHIFLSDTHIINLIDELDLSQKLKWGQSSMGFFDGKNNLPFTSAKDLLLFRPLPLIDRIRTGIIYVFLKFWPTESLFEKITASKWLSKFNGQKAYHRIWAPMLKGKFHEHFDKISMSWMWARIHIRASSHKKNAEKLGFLENGFCSIIEKLEEKIQGLGGEIFYNKNILNIQKQTTNELLLKTNDRNYVFDKLVLTTPSSLFSKVVKNEAEDTNIYIAKLNNIKYLGSITIVFSSDQNLNDYYWTNISDEKAPFVVFVNHTKLVPEKNYNGKFVYYLGGYFPHDHRYFSSSDDLIENEWFEYLKKIFPKFQNSEISEKKLFKFKNAQHIVDIGYKNRIPSSQTPINNLYLLNFSMIYPQDRGMNFAIREAERLSKQIGQKN